MSDSSSDWVKVSPMVADDVFVRALDVGTGVVLSVANNVGRSLTFIPGTTIRNNAIVPQLDPDREAFWIARYAALEIGQRTTLRAVLKDYDDAKAKADKNETERYRMATERDEANDKVKKLEAEIAQLRKDWATERAREAKNGVTIVAGSGGELSVPKVGAGQMTVIPSDGSPPPPPPLRRRFMETLFGAPPPEEQIAPDGSRPATSPGPPRKTQG